MKYSDEKQQVVSVWHHLAMRLSAFAEAMEMSDAEFESRRINAIERRLHELERQNRTDVTVSHKG